MPTDPEARLREALTSLNQTEAPGHLRAALLAQGGGRRPRRLGPLPALVSGLATLLVVGGTLYLVSAATHPQRLHRAPRPAASTPVNGTTGRCHSAQLRLSAAGSNGGGGNVVQNYWLRNAGTVPCTLYGYPGARLLAADGAPMPTTVVRGPNPIMPRQAPATVTLRPGQSAQFVLGFSQISPTGTTSCPIASRLELTPPNAYHPLSVAARIQACQGRLFVSPVAPG